MTFHSHRSRTRPATRVVRGLALALALAFALPVSIRAEAFYVSVDVPSNLGGDDYGTNQFVLESAGTFSMVAALPAGTSIGALHRNDDGSWLFVPDHVVNLNGTDFEPRDVVAYDGVNFTLDLDGSAIGIPDYARIDGLAFGSGDYLFSFDVPVELDATEYGQSDLVIYTAGSWILAFDAQAQGVPSHANLVGAGIDPVGNGTLTFDIPVSLGGTTYLPGTILLFDGSFSVAFLDPSWPPGSQLTGISALPGAGAVPDGAARPGIPLTLDKAGGGDVALAWDASCRSSDDDYEIYQGTIGDFTSHAPLFCSTNGLTNRTLTPGSGSVYFLVAPSNDMTEGSYGLDGSGTERPHLAGACLPQQPGFCD